MESQVIGYNVQGVRKVYQIQKADTNEAIVMTMGGKTLGFITETPKGFFTKYRWRKTTKRTLLQAVKFLTIDTTVN